MILLKLLVCYIKLILCIWLAKMIGVKCSSWNCVCTVLQMLLYTIMNNKHIGLLDVLTKDHMFNKIYCKLWIMRYMYWNVSDTSQKCLKNSQPINLLCKQILEKTKPEISSYFIKQIQVKYDRLNSGYCGIKRKLKCVFSWCCSS